MQLKDGTSFYIALDVGGSSIKAGIVSGDGDVLYHTIFANTAAAERTWEVIQLAIEELLEDGFRRNWSPIRGIGIAAPGRVDSERGVVLEAGNLQWTQFPLKEKVMNRFSLPTVVMNDSNAATLGEYARGGISSENFMCVTLGTGIGSGIILNGQLREGPSFRAGEIGHLVIHPEGFLCSCGKKGCVETIASGANMVKHYISRMREHSSANGEEEIADRVQLDDIVRKAKHGDRSSREILTEAAHTLGLALTYAVQLLDIDTVVLSGGVTKMDWPLTGEVELAMRKHLKSSANIAVVKSNLVDYGALIGVTSQWIDAAFPVGSVAAICRD